MECLEEIDGAGNQPSARAQPPEIFGSENRWIDVDVGVLDQEAKPFAVERVEREGAGFDLFPQWLRKALEGGQVAFGFGDSVRGQQPRKRFLLGRREVRERVIQVEQDDRVTGWR